MVAALITPGSELLIRNVGVNPTRTGVIDILRSMGGRIDLLNCQAPRGDMRAKGDPEAVRPGKDGSQPFVKCKQDGVFAARGCRDRV